MNQKERANLLMHEIVMGARLLMKKTPQEQCEKLSGSQVSACSDPDMMKLAEAQDMSAADRARMDTNDHDSVRAMTIFLMQGTQDITAAKVTQMRRQLGFIFPWDKAVSELTFSDISLALDRARLSENTFNTAGFRKISIPTTCYFSTNTYSDEQMSFNSYVSSSLVSSDGQQSTPLSPAPSAGDAPFTNGRITWEQNDQRSFYIFAEGHSSSTSETFEARGVLDPSNPKRVVDLVRLRPMLRDSEIPYIIANPNSATLDEVEMLLTREENPQVLQFIVRPPAILIKGHPDMKNIGPDDWEFRARKEKFKCVNADATR